MNSFINTLHNAVQKNSIYIIIPNTIFNLQLCKLFYKQNFFFSYRKLFFKKSIYIIAYLNYINNKLFLQSIKRISTPSHPIFWTFSKLAYNKHKTNHFFILSTSKGIISCNDAIKYKIGGLVLLSAY